jgi:hypothetical protein
MRARRIERTGRPIGRCSLLSWLFLSLPVTDVLAEDGLPASVSVASTADEPADDGAASTGNGRCTLRKDSNGWWFVTPGGKPFFSLGVCMFNQGTSKAEYDSAKPSYAALRHYDAPQAWAKASLDRLNAWGFTTIGGWSEYETVRRAGGKQWWLTPVLHMGSTAGAPWFDMWDEKVIRRIEEVAARGITPLSNDDRVLGYYSDNELGWWNAILWKMTLEQPPSSGQRQRLIELVRSTYDGQWQSLLQDFEPQNATNWDELERGGMLWLRPGSGGIRTYRRFLALVADRYYQLMRDTIRKLDPDALYLGDRYQSFYYPEVATAARPYVDVVSTNLNANWNDGTFTRSYLDTLHELTGKPVIVSEFYMSAEQNQSGNKNKVGGFPIVATQADRSTALSNTLRSLAALPYVVGADWFQYYDEPPHGRKLDGEDYNFGLVDIHDRPYDNVTKAFASLDLTALKSSGGEDRRSTAQDGVPPAPADPLGDFQSTHALKNWDRERAYVPASTQNYPGDFYVCWSPDALYLATYVIDIVEPAYYRNADVPNEDRATWTVQVDASDELVVRLGSGRPPEVSDPAIRIQSLGGTYRDIRCITAIELPAERLGRSKFEAGDKIVLESDYAAHGGAYRLNWQGEFVLRE